MTLIIINDMLIFRNVVQEPIGQVSLWSLTEKRSKVLKHRSLVLVRTPKMGRFYRLPTIHFFSLNKNVMCIPENPTLSCIN